MDRREECKYIVEERDINEDINNELLRRAAERGDVDRVKEIVVSGDLNINSGGLDSWTALHFAVSEGQEEVVEYLVERAELEAKTLMGRTPLHIASVRGNHLISQLLLQHGASVNALDNDNSCPLHLTAEYGNLNTLNLLLNNHPDITIRNNNGQVALDLSQNYEIFECLQNFTHAHSSLQFEVGYRRTPFYNTLRHNARTDNVKNILYQLNRQQKIEQSRLESAPQPPMEIGRRQRGKTIRIQVYIYYIYIYILYDNSK